MKEFIISQIKDSIHVKEKMLLDEQYIKKINEIAQVILEAYNHKRKVMFCGNGGSAADAQHLTAELVSKFRINRAALPALSLNTNTSILTSIGNDYEYNYIFERQVEAMGQDGDVLIGISTSGNSNNIISAFKQAKKMGIRTIGLLGNDGGINKEYADISLIVPSNDTPRIQEGHIMIGHIICDIVEKSLFEEE